MIIASEIQTGLSDIKAAKTNAFNGSSVDEIGHNPYELASYLSAKYHVYFR